MSAMKETVLAAIDVGTNAVRLEMARPLPEGNLEMLHQERDAVRPGEGLWLTGSMPREVADRVLSTLRRYGALCRRFRARVRAVATSAVREARNRDEIVQRVRREAGFNLEVISGREEARLICLGVLHGTGEGVRSLCLHIGGGSTEVASAVGERPTNLWSVSLGAVRLAEVFDAQGAVSAKKLKLLRDYAGEAIGKALPAKLSGYPATALGSSGTVRSVVGFAAADVQADRAHALARAVQDAEADEARLLAARDHLEVEPGLAAHALDDLVAVARLAHGAGGHGAHARAVTPAERAVAPQGRQHAIGDHLGHRPGQPQPLARADGVALLVQDLERPLGQRARHLEPYGVRTHIDGGEDGLGHGLRHYDPGGFAARIGVATPAPRPTWAASRRTSAIERGASAARPLGARPSMLMPPW